MNVKRWRRKKQNFRHEGSEVRCKSLVLVHSEVNAGEITRTASRSTETKRTR